MLKKDFIRPLSGTSPPEVEEIVTKKLSEAELSRRLDSFSKINSDLDRLEADEHIVNSGATSQAQEVAAIDDAVSKLSTEPSHWASLLTIDVESSAEPSLSYKPTQYVTTTMTERGSQSPIIVQSGGIFKQNALFGNDWDVESITLLCKRIMVESFIFSLGFSFLLLVSKSAVKSIIITIRENREPLDEVSSYQRLRGGNSIQRAFDHFLEEMESKIDDFLKNPTGSLLIKRLVMVAIFGASSGYFVWLTYCLSMRFGLSTQTDFDKSMRSLKNFSEAWVSFIISSSLVACVGTVFGLLILSAWSMYIDISAFDHSRRNSLLESERIEKQRLLKVQKESVKLMERLSKLDKPQFEKYMELLSKKKVLEATSEDVRKEEIVDKDKERELTASDKLRLKVSSINEASRKLLFYTCPTLYQSEYTSANLGTPLDKSVFNFLSGEDTDAMIDYVNTISEQQLREELGEVDETQPTGSLSDPLLCLVSVRIGLIKEFMPELYTGFDKGIRKFLDEILVKGFERCAFHSKDVELFDYGGQENLASDKPKFELFQFDLPLSSKGYKHLRGGSSSTDYERIPFPANESIKDFHKKRVVKFFKKEKEEKLTMPFDNTYAGPNSFAELDEKGSIETKRNHRSILWQNIAKDRTLESVIADSLYRHRKSRYGVDADNSMPLLGSNYAVSVFAYMPELLANEFNRLQKHFSYRTPPVVTRDSNEIARRNVISNLIAILDKYELQPDNSSLHVVADRFNTLFLAEFGDDIKQYNANIEVSEQGKEHITAEIFKKLKDFSETKLENARDAHRFVADFENPVNENDDISKTVADMVKSITVDVLGNSPQDDDIEREVKRVLRRIVESVEGVNNYDQIKYMVTIFLLQRYVKANQNPLRVRRIRRGVSQAVSTSHGFFGQLLAATKAIPPEKLTALIRKLPNVNQVTGEDVTKSLEVIQAFLNAMGPNMEAMYKEIGGIDWDEKEMNIVLAKLANFDKRPLTNRQKIYAKVAEQVAQALVIEQQQLQPNSLSWQLAMNNKPVGEAVGNTSFVQQAANLTDFVVTIIGQFKTENELPQATREMAGQVTKMARILERAAKHRSSIREFPTEFPTQNVEENKSDSLMRQLQPSLDQLNMFLLKELSDIRTLSRAFSRDEEGEKIQGYFGYYDKPGSNGIYSSPTQNCLWALLGIVYNPGYGQFKKMKSKPFSIQLREPFQGNLATSGYLVDNAERGSATPLSLSKLCVMFDYEDGNGAVERPLINTKNNGGIFSHDTRITRGITKKELEDEQEFDIPVLAKSRESAALCLTQPPNLSLDAVLEHWISYTSAIADTYETAGRADGSYYDQQSVEDILMQYCDDFNAEASYDEYVVELIEKGEMSLEVSKIKGDKSRVHVYDKVGFFQPQPQFDTPLLDKIKLSNPEKGSADEKIYGSSLHNGSVDPAKINKLTFNPTFDLEICRLFTHYPLIMLSNNLRAKIVGDDAFGVKILSCFYRQKSEELKKFKGSEKLLTEFGKKYPYCKHRNGLAGFIHEVLNEEIIPLVQASQSGSDIIVNENYIMRCCESNIIRSMDESVEIENEDKGTKLYQHAVNGVRSSVLRSICKTLPKYIQDVDDLELFFAMVQVEWGSGLHSEKGYVTLEDGKLECMGDVADKVEGYINRARNACITKDGEKLIKTNLISILQSLINDIHKTHPLRSSKVFHEFSVRRLIAFGHFLHTSDKKQKNKMKRRLTNKIKRRLTQRKTSLLKKVTSAIFQ